MALAGSSAQALTVDEVIAKNLEARGGKDRILAIRSLKMTGRMSLHSGMDAPYSLEWKRPNRMRIEFSVMGMTGIQACDGADAWAVMPFMGKTEPERMADEERNRLVESADVDGPLVDYRRKGHRIELLGKELIEGTEAYKLELTRKNGDKSFVYLDAETGLEIKEDGKTTMLGHEEEFESTFGDYKAVDGVLFAHFRVRKTKGAKANGQQVTIETVVLNPDEPEERFRMPVSKPASAPTGG
jgi:outer membrane lipoprotein-sorting protein